MGILSRKSVAMLFLGGATVDERSRLGDTVTKPGHVKPWLKAMSEMDIIAETEGFFISSGLTAIGITDWQAAAKNIHDHYDDFDGFVVVHQLDTLPAAATALSLMLTGIGKPVILCGSPILSADEKSAGRTTTVTTTDYGAKASFINAVQVAVSEISGILVVNGSHIYRGATMIGPLGALSGEILGKIDFGIRFFGQQSGRSERNWKLQSAFETKVAVAEYMPGVDIQHLLHLPRGTRAIFLSSPEGPGTIRAAIQQLHTVLPATLPIIVYSIPLVTDMPGAIAVNAPSRTAALLKAMWGLGQVTEAKKLKKLLA